MRLIVDSRTVLKKSTSMTKKEKQEMSELEFKHYHKELFSNEYLFEITKAKTLREAVLQLKLV